MVTDQDAQNELHLLKRQLQTYLSWLSLGGIRTLPRPKQQPASPMLNLHASEQECSEQMVSSNTIPSKVQEHALPQRGGLFAQDAKSHTSSRPLLFSKQQAAKGSTSLKTYPGLPEAASCKGAEGLARIRKTLGDCRLCKLHHGRNQIVFGQGDPSARLVFVGEGPGAEEDRTGLPFVGAAGDLLNRMIAAMGLKREQVYICNVVKCRPPGNRTPESDEVETCSPFLRAQLQVLAPKVIVALGATPTRFLLQTSAPMSRIRGKFTTYEGIPVMPTYHPAYLLRTPSAKKMVWEDLKEVMAKLNETA